MRKLKKFLFTLLFAFILWALVSTSIENIAIKIKINNFKELGIYQENLSDEYTKYYKVSRETWQEELEVYTSDRIGSPGDIIVGLDSAIENVPIVSEFITFFFGGHSVLSAYKYKDFNVDIDDYENFDANGFDSESVYSPSDRYIWSDNEYRSEVIGLRVKATEEQKKLAFSQAVLNSGDHYNKTFIFNTSTSHYCTDYISKAYNYAGIRLNYDGFACTVQDLIFSNKTYIYYYRIEKRGISHIYYLE